jgi:ribosome-associated protein
MANEFITKEIDKIFNQKKYPFPLNIAMITAWIEGHLKGINLKIINTSASTSLTDYFVICSAKNSVNARAMASEISFQLKRLGYPPISIEGMKDSDWILLDHGDILVHIFLEHIRDIYALDKIWEKSPIEKIPEEYYYELHPHDGEPKPSEEDYF